MDSSSEEDVPLSALVKPKPAAPPAPPATPASAPAPTVAAPAPAAAPKPAPAKSKRVVDSDSEEDVPLSSLTAKPKPPAPSSSASSSNGGGADAAPAKKAKLESSAGASAGAGGGSASGSGVASGAAGAGEPSKKPKRPEGMSDEEYAKYRKKLKKAKMLRKAHEAKLAAEAEAAQQAKDDKEMAERKAARKAAKKAKKAKLLAQQQARASAGAGSAGAGGGSGAVVAKRKRVIESDSDDDKPLTALAPKASAGAGAGAGAGKPKAKKPKAERKPKAAKAPAKKKAAAKPRTAKGAGGRSKEPAKKAKKELKPAEKLDLAMTSHKWWEAEELPPGLAWRTLEHRGVAFPPAYEPHGVKLIYDGSPVDLTPEQEEVATWFAAMPDDGPQLGDAKTRPIFIKNFFRDWKEVLGAGHVVKSFDKCDFSAIRAYLEEKKDIKKHMSKEEKEEAKADRLDMQLTFGYCFVDGHLDKVGNMLIEPPGLFRGRGQHPKTGCIKKRVMPEDVTINIGADALVPACPMPGHRWGKVQHDPSVTWLAMWHENVMGNTKYVFLAASSGFKGKADRDKYEKARKLKGYIDRVRSTYTRMIKGKVKADKQCGTAMWIIDVLALRAGNDKDEDEADTVGCCSLRVEHLTFNEEGDAHDITLDFLGKDSMRYFQTIDFNNPLYGELGLLVFNNLKKFCAGKAPGDDVFDTLDTGTLNRALTNIMPGLSAKVFRTYNASVTLERELPKIAETAATKEKELEYNRANREVAILCNHQRSVPKTFAASFEKMQVKLELLKRQLKELKAMRKAALKGDGDSIRLKSDSTDKDVKAREAHLWTRAPSADAIADRVANWAKKLAAHELAMKNKDDNKDVALGTSKINYMDPRITVAWCKRVECPLERVFPATLRAKFPWASSVPPDWTF